MESGPKIAQIDKKIIALGRLDDYYKWFSEKLTVTKAELTAKEVLKMTLTGLVNRER